MPHSLSLLPPPLPPPFLLSANRVKFKPPSPSRTSLPRVHPNSSVWPCLCFVSNAPKTQENVFFLCCTLIYCSYWLQTCFAVFGLLCLRDSNCWTDFENQKLALKLAKHAFKQTKHFNRDSLQKCKRTARRNESNKRSSTSTHFIEEPCFSLNPSLTAHLFAQVNMCFQWLNLSTNCLKSRPLD